MMFMLNQLEKLDAIEQAKVASRLLADHADELQDFLKALYNYAGKTIPKRTDLIHWGPSRNTRERALEPEQVQEWLERLFLNMVQTGAEESRMFTTGQRAKFFGVSVQTIPEEFIVHLNVGIPLLDRQIQKRFGRYYIEKLKP
jgi:hypothetical protein